MAGVLLDYCGPSIVMRNLIAQVLQALKGSVKE
jgi:hypothetical protein